MLMKRSQWQQEAFEKHNEGEMANVLKQKALLGEDLMYGKENFVNSSKTSP